MMQRRRTCGAHVAVAVAALLATVLGGTARAQDLTSFDRVAARVKLGATIRVTGIDGRTMAGTLTELSASSLRIRAAGTSTDYRAGEIRSIHREVKKPWGRNAAIGLGVGAGIAAIGVATDDCHGGFMCGPGIDVLSVATFAALGAGVGALVAAATPERSIPVYERKTAPSSVRLGVAPVVTPGRQGLTLTLRFRRSGSRLPSGSPPGSILRVVPCRVAYTPRHVRR